MQKRESRNFHQLEIGLASPKEIRYWGERVLPNGESVGEVTSWETVNYKTLKPEPNGLFCQKIFGPVVDYTCACGKKAGKLTVATQGTDTAFPKRNFCPKCGVERTTSQVRRTRMGFIHLKQPLAHTLYASQKPSPLALCLNWPNRKLQTVLYATEFSHLSPSFEYFNTELFSPYAVSWVSWERSNSVCEASRSGSVLRSTANELRSSTNQSLLRSTASQSKPASDAPHSGTKQSHDLISNKSKISGTSSTPSARSRLFFLQPTPVKLSTKQPKLFRSSTQKKRAIFQTLYSKKALSFSTGLYGVRHDMTWREVEAFQCFLMYMWEYSKQTDGLIPHYSVMQKTKKSDRYRALHPQYFPIQTGAGVFQKLLSYYDLVGLQRQMALDIKEVQVTIRYLTQLIDRYESVGWEETKECKKYKKQRNKFSELEKMFLRRLNYFRDFYKAKSRPEWMILSYLPVLPPGLRPITSIRGELVISDLNSLYRKVLTRNRRLVSSTRFGIFDTALSGSWASWCYNLRQVQEAVDSLLKTGKVDSGKTTKSLLDALKGKRGRFRQHLLGKRVDYSGRSVIVVVPKLKIYECGLPKQMAIELFQPFLIQQLRNKGIAFTTTGAKALILEQKPIIWTLLREILQSHPVLLNRAPTLHRLGIQAFLPKLVDGKAILLHPLVCPAFNADFDGDQMAVHIPLSPAARAEAFNLVLASNHLLSPALGNPLLLPTQDMILGCYYLTISKERQEKRVYSSSKLVYLLNKVNNYYFNFEQVIHDYQTHRLGLHTPIWVIWNKKVQTLLQPNQRNSPLEVRVSQSGKTEFFYFEKYKIQFSHSVTQFTSPQECFIRTTPGRILFSQKTLQ